MVQGRNNRHLGRAGVCEANLYACVLGCADQAECTRVHAILSYGLFWSGPPMEPNHLPWLEAVMWATES
jgi:hypothetical protein